MKKQGFTLIELLIVVAIIAILAAIAIPNFLQAQTRAKVARVKADMRSEITALETYYVDHNSYPDTRAGYSPLIGVYGVYELTTPIQYLSALPDSPFIEEFGTGTGDPLPMIEDHSYYMFVSNTTIYDSTNFNPDLLYDISVYMPNMNGGSGNIKYCLKSNGPDGDDDVHVNRDDACLYDPTNGTTASGDMVWFGPGYVPAF